MGRDTPIPEPAGNQLTTLPRELTRIHTFNSLELGNNPWAEPLAPALHKLLIPTEVMDSFENARQSGTGARFARRLLESLDIRFQLDDGDLERIPARSPAIIVANHNSHLDTLTIMAMYRLRDLPHLHPVAATDYFLRTRLLSWFASNIIGIIPIVRSGRDKGGHPLEPCQEALDRGDILIMYPEGSRGEPETLSQFKRGVAHLVKARPQTPVHPLYMHGLGKALPKDSYLLVPFNYDIVAGEEIRWNGNVDEFMALLQARMVELAAKVHVAPWD